MTKLLSWLRVLLFAALPLLILSYFYVSRVHFITLMSLYGAISVGRIALQVFAAAMVKNKKYPAFFEPLNATVIVAVYNENKEAFAKCLQSLKAQTYPIQVIVVDDGSDNSAELSQVCQAYNVHYERIAHAGKREAMYHGFNILDANTQVVMTSDSDTEWDRHAATLLVQELANNPKVGATTGLVDTSNTNTNFLTRLIHLRYFMAFEQERAAQSFFGAVTCVSGPLGAYRREVIDRIKDAFVSQKFLGKKCTFGDDRHLTNLVLGLGYKVTYSKAVAYTESPTTLKQYIKQQARWGKSHWREMLWQLKALPKQHIFLAWDWGVSLLLPFLLTASIVHYVYLAFTDSPRYLGLLAATVVLMSMLRIAEPMRQTKDPMFFLFVLYSFFHLFVLLPLKFYSLATVNITGWGTRGALDKQPVAMLHPNYVQPPEESVSAVRN